MSILRQNSFPAVNLWNQTSYVLPKYSGTGTGQTFPFQEEEIGKKQGVTGPKQVWKLANSIRPWGLKISLPSRPTGVCSVVPTALRGVLTPEALLGGVPAPVALLQVVATWSVETWEVGLPSKTEEESSLSPGTVVGVVALMISSHSSLLWKDNTRSQPDSSMIPPYRTQEVQRPCFFLKPLSPFSGNWQCFCLFNPNISLLSDSLATPYMFSSEHLFSYFAIWAGWEFSKYLSSDSFLLNNFFNFPLLSHFTISSQEDLGHTSNIFLSNLLN